jgi:hypothetical protein
MKIQDGKLVVKDGKAACECCEGGGDDDWVDEIEPGFPGPNGPGPGPDPDDPDCCDCDPEVNPTGCTNCWDDTTDVALEGGGSVLVVERRVRVALRVLGSLRLFAERVDGSGTVTDTYDVSFPIEIIIDSYPGEGDEYCAADVEETDSLTVTAGSEDFLFDYTITLDWDTNYGFIVQGVFNIVPDNAAFTGGNAVYHFLSVTGSSGTTVTNGVIITNTSGLENESDEEAYTIEMGTCRTRDTQSFSGLSSESRSPLTGEPFVRSITELTSLSVDMVVGNVFPCP